MKLTFDWTELLKAFEELDTATTANKLYETVTGKGLWLVGDQGVYLMPNTTDGIHHTTDAPRIVVYARECNPDTMPFDDWWQAKRASFGGDDGVEFLDIEDMRRKAKARPKPPTHLEIEFKPNELGISLVFDPT